MVCLTFFLIRLIAFMFFKTLLVHYYNAGFVRSSKADLGELRPNIFDLTTQFNVVLLTFISFFIMVSTILIINQIKKMNLFVFIEF